MVAVDGDGRAQLRLSYDDWLRHATRLADRLARRGVVRGTPVALALPRVPALPVALLAAWRAGGVVVPLDDDEPGPRRDALLRSLPHARRVRLADPAAAEAGSHAAPDHDTLWVDRLGRPIAPAAGNAQRQRDDGATDGPQRLSTMQPSAIMPPSSM
ncbi:MAG: AMP-binding protein, partial [Acidobacteriota bacterium]